ncbi:YceI family protein [candidate division KSB1 bacterium]|nr:YceI family protein [candidate division KSB1 bacterium]
MKSFFIFVLLFVAIGTSAEFHVDKDQDNRVQFFSDAPVEKIVGTTSEIDGYVVWEGDDYTANSEFYFEVDLTSIDTGIGLRNRHMRDNYLETDKYPFASYKGKIVKATDNRDDTFTFTALGTFVLHGVERKVEIDGKISKTENGYKAESQFEIKLEDYNIERPQFMLLKIGEVIQLDIRFHAQEFKEIGSDS